MKFIITFIVLMFVLGSCGKKSEPQFRTSLTQTGAKLGSDFYFELAAATQGKKRKKEPKGGP